MRRGGAQRLGQSRRQARPALSPAPPQLTISRSAPSLNSNARVEAQPPLQRARRRRRRGVEHQHARLRLRAADSPSRAPGAAARARTAGALDRGGDPALRLAMLPPCQLDSASSPRVTASKALDRAGERFEQRIRACPRAAGDIDRAELAEQLDQRDLLGRRAADQPAIVVQRRRRARACSPASPRLQPRRPALHQQGRGDDAAPGRDARQARQAPCRRCDRDGARRARAR